MTISDGEQVSENSTETFTARRDTPRIPTDTCQVQLNDTETDLIKKDLLSRQIREEVWSLRKHMSIVPLFFDKSPFQPPSKPVESSFFHITSFFRSNSAKNISTSTPPSPAQDSSTPNIQSVIGLRTPLLQYAFNHFVMNFPFLERADQGIWYKIQEFLNAFGRLKFGTYAVSEEELSKRERISIRVEKLLTVLFNTGISTPKKNQVNDIEFPGVNANSNEDEHGNVEGDDVNTYQIKRRPKKPRQIQKPQSDVVHVQILTVRKVMERSYLREKEHAEFVVESHYMATNETFHAAVRYSRIKNFYEKISKEFLGLDLPSPPHRFKHQPHAALYCEKDRLAVQAYLRKLLRNPLVASSSRTKKFLTGSPTDLTLDDVQDSEVRARSVQARAEEHANFLKVAEQQAEELREITDSLVQEISEPGGLNKLARALEEVSDVEQLPIPYQKMIELARINLASTLYRIFCAEETAVIHFQQLRQAHGMIPYRAFKGILMISNPTAMMKAVLDLFLAQPFGQPSILQRVVSSNLSDSLKKKKSAIDELRQQIKDDQLCDHIQDYVYGATEQGPENGPGTSSLNALFHAIHGSPSNPITLVKLKNAKERLEHTNRSQELLEADGSLNEFTETEIMIRNLHKFTFLSTQVRNTELTMDLIFEGITGELLKDILSIFYQPLAQIYKDANISDFVMDVRDFIDKLIKVIEASDIERGATPLDSLRSFTDLVKEYEAIFYRFVHLLYANSRDGLFQRLIAWFESMMDCLREGISREPIDLEKILAREDFMSKKEFRDGFKQDLEKLKEFTFRENLQYFKRLREKMISNLGIDLAKEEMETILATVPIDVVERLMKVSGLTELPQDLRHLANIKVNSKLAHLEIQPNIRINGFSGVNISLSDLMEVQLTDNEDTKSNHSTRESSKSVNKHRHAHVSEPSVPYPNLRHIPKLLEPFMNEIWEHLRYT